MPANLYFNQYNLLIQNILFKFQMQKTQKLTQTIQKKEQSDLHSWEISDPDKYQDPLPMPYRLINQVLEESILKNIYLGVHEIQNKKKDPNYEGSVKQIQSHGTLDLDGITFITKDQTSNLNHIILGDKSGYIYIFDMSKKLILFKKEVVQAKRIQHICCSTYIDGEVSITSVSVIVRGDPTIYIYRYRTGEFKLFLNYQIPISKIKITDENTDISTYPYQSKFSNYGLHLSVSLYDGSVLIYPIPEVNIIKPKQQENKNKNKTSTNNLNLNKSHHASYFANLDQPTIIIQDAPLIIPFVGVNFQPNYRNLINSLKKKEQKPIQPVKQQKKQTKKDNKKQQKKQEIKQQKKPDKEFNQKLLAGIYLNQNGKDHSHDYPLPKFKPLVWFLNELIILPRSKYFEQVKGLRISTKIIISWKYTKDIIFYEFQSLSSDNIPIFLYQQLYKQPKQTKRTKLTLTKIKELANIYPVTALSISFDESLMACGLKQGTICMWDLVTDSIKFNLDKHKNEITALGFFQSYKLVSGSKDGSIHIDDLVSGYTDMKRTNIFESKIPYSVQKVLISNIGLAYVFDSLGNLRLYDLWRGEKIAKLSASPAYIGSDGKTKKWYRSKPILIVDDENVCILSQILFQKNEQQMTVEEKQQLNKLTKYPWRKSTALQIFKIFENLINIFDGLSNIYRRGIDRQKVINIFSNLQLKQLNDKLFQIPKIGGLPIIGEDRQPQKSNKSIPQKDSVSQTSSNSYKSRVKPNNTVGTLGKAVGLTKQALHPQMQLFRRKQTPKTILPNEKWLIQIIRESHEKKQLRQTKLLRETNKLQQGIQ